MPVEDQGVNFNRYMYIPRTLIILLRGDKILLLKGAENKRLWPGLYNGVGGHVEIGEDIFSAAQREVFEETGLPSLNLSLCGMLTINTKVNPGVCIFIFKGECEEGEFVQPSEGTLEWIKESEVYKLPLVQDLHTLLPNIFAYAHGSQPFIAHSEYDEKGNIVINFR